MDGLNSIVDIKKYLSDDSEPLDPQEFKEFWESLSEEEKNEFKNTPLPSE